MKKLLSILLVSLLLLTPVLGLAETWVEFVDRVNKATENQTDSVVVNLKEPVEGFENDDTPLTLPDGVVLVLVGRADKDGAADIGTIGISGSAHLVLQDVWIDGAGGGHSRPSCCRWESILHPGCGWGQPHPRRLRHPCS